MTRLSIPLEAGNWFADTSEYVDLPQGSRQASARKVIDLSLALRSDNGARSSPAAVCVVTNSQYPLVTHRRLGGNGMRPVVGPEGFEPPCMTVQAAAAACIIGVGSGFESVVGAEALRWIVGTSVYWIPEWRLAMRYAYTPYHNTDSLRDKRVLNLATPDFRGRVTRVTEPLLNGVTLASTHGVQIMCVSTGKLLRGCGLTSEGTFDESVSWTPVQEVAVGVAVYGRDLYVVRAPTAQATPRHPVPGYAPQNYPFVRIPFISIDSVREEQASLGCEPLSREHDEHKTPLFLGALLQEVGRVGFLPSPRLLARLLPFITVQQLHACVEGFSAFLCRTWALFSPLRVRGWRVLSLVRVGGLLGRPPDYEFSIESPVGTGC